MLTLSAFLLRLLCTLLCEGLFIARDGADNVYSTIGDTAGGQWSFRLSVTVISYQKNDI